MIRGFFYRTWSKFIHRFNYHHTRRIGPVGDGEIIHKCEWCGVSRVETPMWLIEKRIREMREAWN